MPERIVWLKRLGVSVVTWFACGIAGAQGSEAANWLMLAAALAAAFCTVALISTFIAGIADLTRRTRVALGAFFTAMLVGAVVSLFAPDTDGDSYCQVEAAEVANDIEAQVGQRPGAYTLEHVCEESLRHGVPF